MRNIKEILSPQKMKLVAAIGERVKIARKSLKMKQKELAKQAKVSLTTINRLEKGRQLPHPDNLKEITSQLNIDISDLLNEIEHGSDMNRNELIASIVTQLGFLDEVGLKVVAGAILKARSSKKANSDAI